MFEKMKTIFDPAERNQLIARIQALTGLEQAVWGKMNVAQMVEHCIRWEETMAGEKKIDRVWLGYLFGKMALSSLIGDDKPLRQGTPTLKELIIKEAPENFDQQKQKWIDLLRGYEHASAATYIHPFCGKMTREQTGRMAYKHTDHHLRQFGR
jgi:hypothetical protein